MLRKIVSAIVLVPLAVIIIVFAVANRQAVTIAFDPFDSAHPAYAVTLPLFAIVFILLILGVVVGGIAVWIRQSQWRRTARRLDVEVRQLRNEIEDLRRRVDADDSQRLSPDAPNPHLMFPPPTS